MKWISVALALAGLGAGGFAAWYWYCTSKVSTAPLLARVENGFEPVIRAQAQADEIGGLIEGANESSRLNKVAAQWTDASIFLSALSVVIGSLAN